VRRRASRFNVSCLFWCTSFLLLEYTKQPNTLISWCLDVYSKLSRIFKPQQHSQTNRCLTQAGKTLLFFAKFLSNPSREFSVGNVSVGPGWKIKCNVAILFCVNFDMQTILKNENTSKMSIFFKYNCTYSWMSSSSKGGPFASWYL